MSVIAVQTESRRVRTQSGRPNLRTVQAHPQRRVSAGAVRGATGCRVEVPARRRRAARPAPAPSLLLRLKLVGIAVVAAVGGVVGISGYVSAVVEGDVETPASSVAAGDAAWAHVEP